MKTLKPKVASLAPRQLGKLAKPTTRRVMGYTRQMRNARLFRKNPLCVSCAARGLVREVEEWDHVVPLWMGGQDDESNLQGLCKECHAEKTRAESKMMHWGRK